ncbi:YtxH domain-containing protein [Paenibacillus woosongensis]|uniref:YtxH domain-containing protein n=1 Tax=Paenibacillus woosongensis TaxID=307580 RepID=A0AA95IA38_9BACL|nr:YtxH domain-containing protein [Paenibacillus woosongensis]WHX50827.1 YtxH domain-containing protein [Paenibacillus woosongensis]
MSKGNKGWIWGAAIGTIVGSVTALLLAPKPGKELRKDIADGARQVGEKTGEIAGKVTEQSAHLAEIVKETAGNLIHDIQAWRESKGEEESPDEGKEVQISAFPGENETEEAEDFATAAIEAEASEAAEMIEATEQTAVVENEDKDKIQA